MNRYALIKRTCELYPSLDYLNKKDVAHARKAYLRSLDYLRSKGMWILDKPVVRKCGSSAI